MVISTEQILASLIQIEDGQAWSHNDDDGWKLDSQEYYCYWEGISCDAVDQSTVVGIFLPSSKMKGTLPSELGELLNLRELSLPDNELEGTIPSAIAKLPHLRILNLSQNKISGSVPTFASPSFTSLDLSSNKISGSLCNDFGKHHERMTDIDLTDNQITGVIPDSISFMTMLDEISISKNKFSGTIPVSLGYLRSLRYVYLDHNFLVGQIPSTIVRFSSPIAELWLQENLLSGTIPAVIADMTELFNFYVDGNKFTGTVPDELCRKELNEDFFENVEEGKRNYCESIACPEGHVSEFGIYPCIACEFKYFNPYLGRVGKCINVNQRDILNKLYDYTDGDNWKGMTRHDWVKEQHYYCSFSGITCDKNENVVSINLKNRGLSGTIPEELGFLQYLQELDLSDNDLTGFIPSDLRWAPIENLDVTGNTLRGVVPPMLCLKEGINGNGDDGQFDCRNIACEVGFHSKLGRQGSSGKVSCAPCKHEGNYLGSKKCDKRIDLSTPTYVTLSTIDHVSPSEGMSGTSIFVFCFGFGTLALSFLYKRYKERTPREIYVYDKGVEISLSQNDDDSDF